MAKEKNQYWVSTTTTSPKVRIKYIYKPSTKEV